LDFEGVGVPPPVHVGYDPVVVAAPSLRTFDARQPRAEQRIALDGVPWRTYVLLRDGIDEPHLKMTYCEGVLELMSPSEEHELNKKWLARLLELYAFVKRIPIVGYGSTTFKREARARGAEPDECWRVGPEAKRGQLPDLVLEVIETRPLLDKLSVYDGLEVTEVWLFERGKLSVHRRKARGGYSTARRSTWFPELDPRLLERYAARIDQDAALHEFAALARGGPKRKARRR
jgi:Uma2 family endonuclease